MPVAKAFTLLIVFAMAVQVIRPLGLPGLRKRSDAWKLIPVALVAIAVVTLLRIAIKGE